MAGKSRFSPPAGGRGSRFEGAVFLGVLLVTSYWLLAAFFSVPVFAAETVSNIIDTSATSCYKYGDYPLGAFLDLAQRVIKFIFGISGALALLMFVYGGFMWLISGGEQKRVQEGQDTLMHAVVGLAIIFGSWVFINFIVATFTGTPGTAIATIFGKPWNEYDGAGTCLSATWCNQRCQAAHNRNCVPEGDTYVCKVPSPPPAVPPAPPVVPVLPPGGMSYVSSPGFCCYVDTNDQKRVKPLVANSSECATMESTVLVLTGQQTPFYCPQKDTTKNGLSHCWQPGQSPTSYVKSDLCSSPTDITWMFCNSTRACSNGLLCSAGKCVDGTSQSKSDFDPGRAQ